MIKNLTYEDMRKLLDVVAEIQKEHSRESDNV
jgi:hypothetical protein